MIYKFVLFLFLIFPYTSNESVHKYYLSVTDVQFNEESGTLQMITKVFYDDLEDALNERYEQNLVIDSASPQEPIDLYIKKYINQKLAIGVNGRDVELTVIGKEYEDDYVVIYIESEPVSKIEHLSFENKLLMDAYESQQNMIHFDVYTQKKSFVLNKGNTKAVLNF